MQELRPTESKKGTGQRSLESSGVIRFPCPKPFDGTYEALELFAMRLRTYLHSSSPAFGIRIREATETAQTRPDFELLPEGEQAMTITLHNALVAFCEGYSATLASRDEDRMNGFETWRRRWRRYSTRRRQKSAARMSTHSTLAAQLYSVGLRKRFRRVGTRY